MNGELGEVKGDIEMPFEIVVGFIRDAVVRFLATQLTTGRVLLEWEVEHQACVIILGFES